MYVLGTKKLTVGQAFEFNGIQYPADWLQKTSLEEKQAIGITEEPDPEWYDDRYYWGVDNPKDLDMLKASFIIQIKETAYSFLSPTDYKIIRSSETGSRVDLATLNARANIRTKSDEFETAINACTTVEELAALSFDWGA
jgi:hypothetical protein